MDGPKLKRVELSFSLVMKRVVMKVARAGTHMAIMIVY